MTTRKKRTLTALIALALALSPLAPRFTLVAEESAGTTPNELYETHPFVPGVVPEPAEHIYPSEYDSRSLDFFSLDAATYAPSYDSPWISSVKDQGQNGICWTFGAYGALEADILKNGGPENDFSELHMAYATSSTGGNSQGFNRTPDGGGHRTYAAAYLMRGKELNGAVDESTDPYTDIYATIPTRDVSSTASKAKSYTVKNIIYLSDGKADNDLIKASVVVHGAVAASMFWNDSGTSYNASTKAYYYSGGNSTNHAITIVGWDDNFSKDNFNAPKPSIDGAWRVKNSWGSAWGDGGYFWISYADTNFPETAYVFDGAVPYDDSLTVYEYDPLGHLDDMYSSAAIYATNIFTVNNSGEQIESIKFFNSAANHKVATYLVKSDDLTGLTGINVNSLTPLSPEKIYEYPGWYTIDLPTPVALNTAQFAVILKYTSMTSGVDTYVPRGRSNSGSSYYSTNGSTWQVYARDFNIKAVTSPAPPPSTINGWQKEDGKWYFYAGDAKQKGWIQSGDNWYYLDATSGARVANNWAQSGTNWYYLGADGGAMVTNTWIQSGDNWYYLGANGARATNAWAKSGTNWHYLGADGGAMVTSTWIQSGDNWYYLGADGARVANAWAKSGTNWHYLGANGAMATNAWIQSDGNWYYFGANGVRVADAWAKSGSNWYYLGANGAMVSNTTIQSGGNWYYLGTNGARAANYWAQSGGKWYYFGTNSGARVENDWVLYGGSWYYLKSSGVMAAGETIALGGQNYTFAANGVCTNKDPQEYFDLSEADADIWKSSGYNLDHETIKFRAPIDFSQTTPEKFNAWIDWLDKVNKAEEAVVGRSRRIHIVHGEYAGWASGSNKYSYDYAAIPTGTDIYVGYWRINGGLLDDINSGVYGWGLVHELGHNNDVISNHGVDTDGEDYASITGWIALTYANNVQADGRYGDVAWFDWYQASADYGDIALGAGLYKVYMHIGIQPFVDMLHGVNSNGFTHTKHQYSGDKRSIDAYTVLDELSYYAGVDVYPYAHEAVERFNRLFGAPAYSD